MLEQVLLRIVAFTALGTASLGVYLVALRFVAWDLVPTSALPHCRWWQRHAPAFLWVSLAITMVALAGLAVLAIIH